MIVKHSHAIFERTVSIILVGLTVYVGMVILDLVSGVEVCKRSGVFFLSNLFKFRKVYNLLYTDRKEFLLDDKQ